jgi:hypothetical protein
LGSSKLRFPRTRGKEVKYDVLPKKLEFGYYHVKILSDDPDIHKVIFINPQHWYHSEEIKFLLKVQKTHNINFTIELITTIKYNAYIYPSDELVPFSYIFGVWYKTLKKLKTEFPNNTLVKLLGSRLTGTLSMLNTIKKSEQETIDENLDIGMSPECEYMIVDYQDQLESSYYTLLKKSESVYKEPILGRIHHLIPMYSRIHIAKVALVNLPFVVRIQTDGIVFTEEIDYKSFENLNIEKKHTGHYAWKTVNTKVEEG